VRSAWANITLLVLLLVQLITGYLTLVNGRDSDRWIWWLHGIGAYAVIVLFYWKGSVILDTLRRKSVWTWRRFSFFLMLGLLFATVAAGLLWSFYGPIYLAGFSLVSIHIYLAIPLMILMLWHSWQMRFIFRVPDAVSRRSFLRTAVTAAAGLVTWQMVNLGKRWWAIPGAARRFTGSYERGSFTGNFPSVSWILDHPDPIDLSGWKLTIDGMVARPLTLTYDTLQQLPPVEVKATLDCTGGWYTTQVWRGVRVADLLRMAGVAEGGQSVTIGAITGYKRRFSLARLESFILATHVAERPLSHGHGFPLGEVGESHTSK
jgi:hypothetical protein